MNLNDIVEDGKNSNNRNTDDIVSIVMYDSCYVLPSGSVYEPFVNSIAT